MSRLQGLRRTLVLLVAPGVFGSPGWMTLGIALQVASAVSLALYPYGLRLFTDGVLLHHQGELTAGVFLVAALFIAWWVFVFLGNTTGFTVSQRGDLYLTARIAELVNQLPGLEHFERPDYLRELEVLNQDRRILAAAPQQILLLLFVAVRTVVMMVLLVAVNPYFLLLPVAGLAPLLCDSASVRYRRRSDDALAESVRLTNRYFELAATAASAKELRTFGLVDEISARRTTLADTIVKRTTRAGFVAIGAGLLGWVIFAAACISLLSLVISQAIDGHASPGQVLMVVVLAQSVQLQLGTVASSSGQLMRARLTARRFIWLEDEALRMRSAATSRVVPDRLTQGITLERLNFRYPGTDSEVLTDVSLHLPAGSSVAIVGENGAGKTTLAKLLSKMYAPTSGTILIDGASLDELGADDWRARIASTFQDFARYQLRAGHAVGIGDQPRMHDDAAATMALRDAGADSLLASLERGLDTQLGRYFPDGQELSGGEWQKVALGRGRMRTNPLLLVLDEPTASLDPHAESTLFDHYIHAAGDAAAEYGTITLLVSHRFSTVRMADLIVVLDGGRVVEFGSHTELIERAGQYAELFALQERSYR